MSIDPAILRAMAAAGASTDVIIAAVEAAHLADQERIDRKRAGNAERQRRFKAKNREEVTGNNAGNALPDVTGVSELPSPDKAPQTPKINPTPHGCGAPAREHAHEGPIPGELLPLAWLLTLATWHAELTAARAMALNALWHGTPPPHGVTDECWSGFLAHRKAMPKAGRFTTRAYQLLCEKLAALAADGWPPGELLDTAIDRNWITVFPPKDARNDNPPRHSGRSKPGRYRDPLFSVDPADIGLAG